MDTNNLGLITLEGFMNKAEGRKRKMKFTFIACGQFGGRQGDELARLGHEVIATNTSDSDLSDLKIVNKRIKLEGYNGAVKDISRGQAAIKDNRKKIVEMMNMPEIREADHVFVIGGMGGGTGNAATPMLLNNLSKVRKPFNGKPSYGAIISVPGSWEQRGIKKNARWGLSHISELINKNGCGAVFIIDNEKLYQMSDSQNNKLEWTDYGNTTFASLLTEISFLTSIPAGKTFDEDELLDFLSTPGYAVCGKTYIKQNEAVSLSPNEITDLLNRSVDESPIASDYEYDLDATNGFICIIHPDNHPPIVNESLFRSFEERFNDFIASAEKPHSGLIENNDWSYITNDKNLKNESKRRAILYTGVISAELPSRISQMLDEIEQDEHELEKKRQSRKSKTLDLSQFKEEAKKEIAVTQEPVNQEFDLFSDDERDQEDGDSDWSDNLDLDL